MMASHCPEAQGKSIKRAVLTESLLQVREGAGLPAPYPIASLHGTVSGG